MGEILGHIQFNNAECLVMKKRYQDGNIAFQVIDLAGEKVCHASLNIPKIKLADNEIIIGDYCERRAY